MSDTYPHYLKCHTCKQRLVLTFQFKGSNHKTYECPEAHSSVVWIGNQIVAYTLFWDAKDDGTERYRLEAQSNITELFLKTGKRFKPLLCIESLLPLDIKDNVIQLNNLVPRLKKMKAFT